MYGQRLEIYTKTPHQLIRKCLGDIVYSYLATGVSIAIKEESHAYKAMSNTKIFANNYNAI